MAVKCFPCPCGCCIASCIYGFQYLFVFPGSTVEKVQQRPKFTKRARPLHALTDRSTKVSS